MTDFAKMVADDRARAERAAARMVKGAPLVGFVPNPDLKLTSPVPQRPAGPYCSTCGRTEGHWNGCDDVLFGDPPARTITRRVEL